MKELGDEQLQMDSYFFLWQSFNFFGNFDLPRLPRGNLAVWLIFLLSGFHAGIFSKSLKKKFGCLFEPLFSAGPPTADAPVVRGYFGVGAESGTRASRFECKDSVAVKHKGWLVLFQRSGLIFSNSTDSLKII